MALNVCPHPSIPRCRCTQQTATLTYRLTCRYPRSRKYLTAVKPRDGASCRDGQRPRRLPLQIPLFQACTVQYSMHNRIQKRWQQFAKVSTRLPAASTWPQPSNRQADQPPSRSNLDREARVGEMTGRKRKHAPLPLVLRGMGTTLTPTTRPLGGPIILLLSTRRQTPAC
jgi:hypothetical protein